MEATQPVAKTLKLSSLTYDQRAELARIVVDPGALIEKKAASANALVRKGLATRTDVKVVKGSELYPKAGPNSFLWRTIRGSHRLYTLCRFELTDAGHEMAKKLPAEIINSAFAVAAAMADSRGACARG